MKKTFKQIREFNDLFSHFAAQGKNSKTKLVLCGIKLGSQLAEPFDNYNEELEIKYIDLALVDKETGAVIINKSYPRGGYVFSKDNQKAVVKSDRTILKKWDKTEVEFKPVYSSDVPKDLGEQMIDAFKGFIIDPNYVVPAEEEEIKV